MFKTMGKLLQNAYPEKEDINKIQSFVLVKWLSNNRYTVIPANQININYDMPIQNQYRFLDDYFKLTGIKNKIRFIRYNKNTSTENKIINNISLYYNINKSSAEKYYSLMDDAQKKRFKNLYSEGTEGTKGKK